MAINTPKTYRNQVVYSIFIRNYCEEGSFEGVRKDLDRIKKLGVDIIWLLPIHPIGKIERKGSLGSPYAISNYRKVNPEYGTLDEFKRLVCDIHKHGMKCIIDVVYNHTSPDSWLVKNHPEWFYHKPDGCFGNKVGEWLDVIDLDYSNKELWDYQIETLKIWAEIVDGFRCDVAPLIPLEFWLKARAEVAAVNPDCFWLSESVEPCFTVGNRAKGLISLSDSEIFQAFDASYEYDVYYRFKDYLKGKISLAEYAEDINRQEYIYPANYIKLRFLENHDNARAAFMIPDDQKRLVWTAFIYFQKGMTLLYAGQERGIAHLPGLFDEDLIRWNSKTDDSQLLSKLYEIKKDPIFTDSCYKVDALPGDVLFATHSSKNGKMIGIFPVSSAASLIEIDLPDGVYSDLIRGEQVEIHAGMMAQTGKALIIKTSC